MDNYSIGDVIGKGRGSTVYKGRKKFTIKHVAIKSVEKKYKDRVLNEVRVMYKFDHPNILKFYAWYESTNNIWLILEYVTGGDMLNVLRQDVAMPEASTRVFARDIVAGLQYVHEQGYIYGDLKPSNVLVNEYGMLKLCDFGLSLAVPTDAEQSDQKSKTGTPYYMAPELFHSQGVHSFASDFWAFGCLLYELMTGNPPFHSRSAKELMHSILNDEVEMLASFSNDLVELLDQCLQKDPRERITWDELCSHGWWGDMGSLTAVRMPDQPLWEERMRALGGTASSASGSRKSRDNGGTGPRPVRGGGTGEFLKRGPGLAGAEDTTLSGSKKSAFLSLKQSDITRLSFNAAVHANKDDQEENETQQDNNNTDPAKKPARKRNIDKAAGDVEMMNYDVELTFDTVADAVPAAARQDRESNAPKAGDPVDYNKQAREILLSTHDTNLVVKDLVHNISIQRQAEPKLQAGQLELLTFECLSAKELMELDQDQLTAFLQRVHTAVSQGDASDPAGNVRVAVLIFVQTLMQPWVPPAGKKDAAMGKNNEELLNQVGNVIVKSFMDMFVAMLDQATPLLRLHLLKAIGLMLRHASAVGKYKQPHSALIQALTLFVTDKQIKIRQRAACALGELLFLIAETESQSPSAATDASSCPTRTVEVVAEVIDQREEDVVVIHYLCKTIENIAARGWAKAEWFGRSSVVMSLWTIFRHAAEPQLQLTVISAISLQMWKCPNLIQPFLEVVQVSKIVQILDLNTSAKGNVRVQRCLMNLLNVFIHYKPALVLAELAKEKEKRFVPCLMRLLTSEEEAATTPSNKSNAAKAAKLKQNRLHLQGKGVLCVALLACNDWRWLAKFSELNFIQVLDKLAAEGTGKANAKEKSNPNGVEANFLGCLKFVETTIPALVNSFLQQKSSSLSERFGGAGRPRPVSLNPQQAQELTNLIRNITSTLRVVWHVLPSVLLRPRLLQIDIPYHCTELLRISSAFTHLADGGARSFRDVLLSLLDTVARHTDYLEAMTLDTYRILLLELFSLAIEEQHESSRFEALKTGSSMLVFAMHRFQYDCSQPLETDDNKREAEAGRDNDPTRMLNNLILGHILRNFATILGDASSSIQQQAIRLLSSLVELQPALATLCCSRFPILKYLLAFFKPGSAQCSVHCVSLLTNIVSNVSALRKDVDLAKTTRAVLDHAVADKEPASHAVADKGPASHALVATLLLLLQAFLQKPSQQTAETVAGSMGTVVKLLREQGEVLGDWRVKHNAIGTLLLIARAGGSIPAADLPLLVQVLSASTASNVQYGAISEVRTDLLKLLLVCANNQATVGPLKAVEPLRSLCSSIGGDLANQLLRRLG